MDEAREGPVHSQGFLRRSPRKARSHDASWRPDVSHPGEIDRVAGVRFYTKSHLESPESQVQKKEVLATTQNKAASVLIRKGFF